MNSKVQLLKWMLEDVRAETLKGIEGLSKEKLFQAPVEGEFPIGAFLMHFGECDTFWYSQLTGNQMPEELRKRVLIGFNSRSVDDLFRIIVHLHRKKIRSTFQQLRKCLKSLNNYCKKFFDCEY